MMNEVSFKNIKFLNINSFEFKKIIKKKGLFVFPSAPGLASINSNKKYYESLKMADHVFFDSGFFVLLLRIFKNLKVNRFSGFKFLDLFFKHLKLNKDKSIFCIDPNNKFSKNNKKFLKKIGLTKIYNYIAPKYHGQNLIDKKLLNEINFSKPDFIITNIGGGVQEILGLYLKKNLNKKTLIICTGGAISFFTGDQAPINKYIDKFFLGWFVRLIFDPLMFYKRILYAFKLVPIVLFNNINEKNEKRYSK